MKQSSRLCLAFLCVLCLLLTGCSGGDAAADSGAVPGETRLVIEAQSDAAMALQTSETAVMPSAQSVQELQPVAEPDEEALVTMQAEDRFICDKLGIVIRLTDGWKGDANTSMINDHTRQAFKAEDPHGFSVYLLTENIAAQGSDGLDADGYIEILKSQFEENMTPLGETEQILIGGRTWRVLNVEVLSGAQNTLIQRYHIYVEDGIVYAIIATGDSFETADNISSMFSSVQ